MSSSSNPQIGADEATVGHVRRVLHGFAPGYGDAPLSDRVYEIRVPPSKLPMPVFARQVMVVFGAEYLGTSDKVAWRYGFTVDGVPCMLESAKWGIQLNVDTAVGDAEAAKDLAARVIDKLAAAQRTINKSVLAPRLADQIQAGNVTIINQYMTLRGSYEYFRGGAEQAYAGAGRTADRAGLVDLIAGRGAREGWWNTLAMVSSYFSTLEHVLIGCLPFTSFDPATENLTWVIGAKWNEKMQQVVDLSDPEAGKQFAALREIAEQFRNTYSHGGFGREGRTSMVVHLPRVGDVPVTLDEFGVRPELLFVPAVKADFEKICATFDCCDDWLANGPLADGHRWVAAGLDLRFDVRFRANLTTARREERFEEFLNDEALYIDSVMNWEI
jgi:hypothetical protein